MTRPPYEMSAAQRAYLKRGVGQPGGRLPLFDWSGQKVSTSTVQACVRRGWAERVTSSPQAQLPHYRLTESGSDLLD